MTELKFEIDHSIRIKRPAAFVFEALVSPTHLNRYFTVNGEGRLDVGSKIIWRWNDFPGDTPVEVIESTPPNKLVIQWDSHKVGYKTTIIFDLEDQKEKGTIVRVREGTWKTDMDGLQHSYNNSGGWMHMLCCLKAYLDFNLDLRSIPFPDAWKE
jgi:uncharacterized protein YndB with AHSA1/START domain